MEKYRIKSILIIGVSCLAIFSACTKNRFVIEGKIESSDFKMVYLSEYNLTGEKIIDSCKIRSNGTFKFKSQTTQPDLYRVIFNKENFVIIVASPNEHIKISSPDGNVANNYKVEGSEYSAEVRQLILKLLKTRQSLDSLYKIYISYKDKKGYDTLLNKIDLEYNYKIKAQRSFSIKFLIEHMRSPSSIVALYQQYNQSTYVLGQTRDLQYIKVISDTLYKYYPESRAVKALWTDRNKLLSDYNKIRFNQTVNSLKPQLYPDIKLPNTKGDTVSLLKIDAKLIIVYFWSPLDKNCQTVMSSMHELYQKYKNQGLELFNVALIDDVGYWSNLIAKVGIMGINVIDVDAENSILAKVYNVKQVPSTVLISSKTGILARNIFGDNLEQQLKKNLK
jgi:thiol-disulfide isomerase/thioredoxin